MITPSSLLLWFEQNQLDIKKGLLLQAFTHRSFSSDNNERLEFLGDAILDLIIGEALFKQLTQCKEGQLSRLRALLVEGKMLAELARELGISIHIRLGKGESQSGGSERDSILAGTFEAMVGAVYLEQGFALTKELILMVYRSRLDNIDHLVEKKDAKTALQEYLQKTSKKLPIYTVEKTEGLQHQQQFFVSCRIPGADFHSEGEASSKKSAEILAAQKMLDLFKQGSQ